MPFLTLWKKKRSEVFDFQGPQDLSSAWCSNVLFLHSLFTLYAQEHWSSPLLEHALNFPTSMPLLTEPQVGDERTFFYWFHLGSYSLISDFLNVPYPWRAIPCVSSLSSSWPILESPPWPMSSVVPSQALSSFYRWLNQGSRRFNDLSAPQSSHVAALGCQNHAVLGHSPS